MNAPVKNPQAIGRLMLDESFGWRRFERGDRVFWFKGFEQTRSTDTLAAEAAALPADRTGIENWLAGLDGFFALALEMPGASVAAVDRIASMPLIWAEDGGTTLVTQDGPAMEQTLDLGPEDIEPDAAAAIALAGYTIGTDTLYRGVRRLPPGQFLWVDGDGAATHRYHQWRPWAPEEASVEDLAAPLSALHERLIEKLIASAGGRPILVPLSAGLDSRMIVSGLVEAGYRNVRTFAYGRKGNREAVVSRKIAERLGVPWSFVSFTNGTVRRQIASSRHRDYVAYADSLFGIHFPQDYVALTAMLDEHGVGPDTILVNGQSGDFITGNHILPPLTEPAADASPEMRADRVVESTLRKHFKQWRALRSEERLGRIRSRLAEEIEALGGMPNDAAGDHGIYEYLEFENRQTKYVVHGQRCYEFLGLDWRLPLWDREYLDFWERAPLAAKVRQNLYRSVLERDNWGGVWRDVPVNPLRVRPAWLVPIRLAAKACHAPFGRDRWHRFEKRFLQYWMAPLCSYAPWSYRRVAGDARGHETALAFHAEAYLNRKGLGLDGMPLAR